MMDLPVVLMLIVILLRSANSNLIRSIGVYESIIQGVCQYYQCKSIIIFYSNQNYSSIQGSYIDVDVSTNLRSLYIDLNRHMIQVLITNIDNFIKQDPKTLRNLENKLMVFLDDSDSLRTQFKNKLVPLTEISDPAWLIFFKSDTKIDEYFEDLYIPFNCRFMVSKKNIFQHKNNETIWEIYKVAKSTQLKYSILGHWSYRTKIKLSNLDLYQRRHNLYGHSLRVTLVNSIPNSIITVDKNNNIKFKGIFGSIMELLEHYLNFSSTYLVVSNYGIKLNNGSWIGGMATLVNNDSDIFPTNLRMTSSRAESIHFTTPVYLSSEFFFFKNEPIVPWKTFFKPLDSTVWFSIVCSIILNSALLIFIVIVYQRKCLHIQDYRRPEEIFMYIFGTYCNQGMPISSINSIKVISFTIHVTAMIICTAYSGILVSFLTLNVPSASPQTLKDLLYDKSYRIGLLKNSALHDFFRESKNHIVHYIYDKKISKESSLPMSYMEGLQRVCNEKKYSFIAPISVALQFQMKNCTLIKSNLVRQTAAAIGLPRNSPYRGLINHYIYLLKNNGVINKIMYEWTRPASSTLNEKPTYESVDFLRVIPLVYFFLGSCILSIVLLGCEKLIHKIISKQKYQRVQSIRKSNLQTIVKIYPKDKIYNKIS
ncbi:probable glutamate receptor [Chelonus insularis]|uniref:probable glutamate receptor n=1 Tax=Chelonus insularis TaxID=460826 RepID=UPI00158ACC8B|nr:probable glutamate receptor [Chelonus insularis]